MHVPGIKNKWLRRLNLLWIIPYLLLAWIPVALYVGLVEIGNPFRDLSSVWNGDKYVRR